MSNDKTIRCETLSSIAAKYGITPATLKGMIQLYPELMEKVKVFKNEKKRTLPPVLVQQIFETIGYP